SQRCRVAAATLRRGDVALADRRSEHLGRSRAPERPHRRRGRRRAAPPCRVTNTDAGLLDRASAFRVFLRRLRAPTGRRAHLVDGGHGAECPNRKKSLAHTLITRFWGAAWPGHAPAASCRGLTRTGSRAATAQLEGRSGTNS